MQQVVRQLEQVRRAGRVMLVAQAIFRFVGAIGLVALALAVIDFGLRLPGWLRLGAGLIIVGVAAWWLVTRVGRAMGFKPDLSQLALRAERMYPQLAGALASGVEFAAHQDDYADSQTTASLTGATLRDAEKRLGTQSIRRLLEPALTMRIAVLALLVVVIIGGVAMATPQAAWLATQRWLMPLSDAEWPRRTDVTCLVDKKVHPIDAPLPLTLRVDRGYRAGMRAAVIYQVIDADGNATAVREALLTDQSVSQASAPGSPAPGTATGKRLFESMLDLAPDLKGVNITGRGVRVIYHFAAGDAETAEQEVLLVPRPAVESITAAIEPPKYAQELAPRQIVAMDQQTGRVAAASALVGSTVRLTMTLNKPVPDPAGQWATLLPGLAGVKDVAMSAQLDATTAAAPTIELTFALHDTIESPIQLKDEHGLTNLSDRVYRFVAITDKPPTAHLSQPAADESVLPTALVNVEGKARDDVGVASVSIEAAVNAAATPANERKPEAELPYETLNETTGRATNLETKYDLDLTPRKLKVGDEVLLVAVAHDVFDLNGSGHDPVRSNIRRLRIVDEATLIGQIRNELAGLRQQAIRMDTRQREITDVTEQAPDKSHDEQQRLGQSLQRQGETVETLKGRAARNRLSEPQLDDVLNKASKLLQEAQSASQAATQRLDRARRDPQQAGELTQQAKKDQQSVNDKLAELVALLDQGKDLVTIQLQLRQLAAQQESLAGETRELMPRTLGRKAEDLSPAERDELNKLADRQQGLAEQAQNMVRQMQSSAEAMRRQSASPRDKASAAALEQAAAIAQRQGLEQNMQQAAQQAKQNQLSQSGQQQNQAMDTIQSMLRELKDQDKKQQEILQRTLAQLGDAIERLIKQQEAQLARLKLAQLLTGLDEPMVTLRRSTMTVQETAKEAEKTAPIAEILGKAVDAQAAAVIALRASSKNDALKGETDALLALKEALEKLREAQQQQQNEEDRANREQLRQQYEKLVKEQEAIRKESADLAAVEGELSRKQRQESLQLGHREDELRAEAKKLGDNEEIQKTLIFRHLHERVDSEATAAVDQLRQANTDALLLRHQSSVANDLKMMADALAEANRDNDSFAQRSGDGGGNGGGQPQKQPLIPPVAELKLLRNVQASIYDSTRSLNDIPTDKLAPDARSKETQGIGERQRELFDLGERLIKRVEEQAQQANQPKAIPQPVVPPPDEKKDGEQKSE